MTTIKDIARLAGVSIATVSRVLNGQSGVSDSKRQKVLHVAEETHYSLSRFAQALKNHTPHFMVLLVDDTLTEEAEEDLLLACVDAQNNFQTDLLKIEYFSSDELPQAVEQLKELQTNGEDLEGILIIGNPPDSLNKPLSYLRGRGCPIVLAGTKEDVDILPLSLIQFDAQMFYQIILERALSRDKEKKGIFIHESPTSLSGEGLFTQPAFEHYLDQLKENYPEHSVRVHNKGPFTPELLIDASLILADSVEASEAIVNHYKDKENAPLLILFGSSETLQQALAKGQISMLVEISGYELAYCSMNALLQRLILRRTFPERMWIYPRIYTKALLPLLKHRERYPALFTLGNFMDKN